MQKLLLLSLSLVIAGCASSPHSDSVGATDADAAFDSLASKYLTGYLQWRPQIGTALGFHEYDGKLTDLSRPSLDAELARLKSFDQQLSASDTKLLSTRAAYDYRILRNAIRREIFGFEQMQIHSQNPMTYASTLDVNIYIKRNFAPLADRVHSIIAILNQAPQIMAAARANLADSLPRPQIETAIEQANGAADFLGKDLVGALKDFKNETLTSQFNAANQRAIEELHGYVAYLKEQKVPKANDHFALGREKYAELLRHGEMVSLSPEELLEIGLRELRSKQQTFAESARLIDPNQMPIEVFRAIQKDHPTEQSLIPDTAKNLEMIRQFVIYHRIITLPSSVRAKVLETPQFMRATSFASMDTPGPFETKATEAYYYVTPVEPEWDAKHKEEHLRLYNPWVVGMINVHEAYPGHYLQFLYAPRFPTKTRKLARSATNSEGWAHYAEQMAVDQGFGTGNPKVRLAQLQEALLRDCRYVVGIQLHTAGWTVEQGAALFVEQGFQEAANAYEEARRGAYNPTYLYYTLGKLEIQDLAREYMAKKHATLRQFHDAFVTQGPLPIPLIRQILLRQAG